MIASSWSKQIQTTSLETIFFDSSVLCHLLQLFVSASIV